MSDFSTTRVEPGSLLDPREYAANQRGEITAAQRKRLDAILPIYVQSSIITAMAGILVSVVILIPALGMGTSSAFFVPMLLVVAGAWLWAGLGVRGYLRQRADLRRDCDTRAIRQAEGRLASTPKGYVFQAGERMLFLPAPGPNGLLPDAAYRAYYLDASGFVLSVEAFPAAGM